MEIIGQILGFGGSIFLFYFAYRFFEKEKFPTSSMFALIGVFILVCSFPWFQGFVKTWVISDVNSKLTSLGQQVNDVQASTSEMQKQLGYHQSEIEKSQRELNDVQTKIRNAQLDVAKQQTNITEQYYQISTVQAGLASAQTNIDLQEQKIEDVQFLVDNLFSKTAYENFPASDTNHVISFTLKDGSIRQAIKLQYVLIPESLQVIVTSSGVPQTENQLIKPYKNVFFNELHGYDINNTSYSIKYVKDARTTNLVESVELRDGVFYLDGIAFPFPGSN